MPARILIKIEAKDFCQKHKKDIQELLNNVGMFGARYEAKEYHSGVVSWNYPDNLDELKTYCEMVQDYLNTCAKESSWLYKATVVCEGAENE